MPGTIDLGQVVGPQGPQGATGPQGPQGSPGPNAISAQTSTLLNGVLIGNGTSVDVSYLLHHNFIDNSFFRAGGSQENSRKLPINSRGLINYTVDSYSVSPYTIDRWFRANQYTRVQVVSSALKILSTDDTQVPSLRQRLTDVKALRGQMVTLSLYLLGSTIAGVYDTTISGIYSATAEFPYEDPSSGNGQYALVKVNNITYARILCANNNWYIDLTGPAGGSWNVGAVKLELGEKQTLGYLKGVNSWVISDIPNFADEYIRCRTNSIDTSDVYSCDLPATQKLIADIQTPYASRAYNVGEYFCLNGKLYRVTSNIGSGSSFVIGTNCVETQIGTELYAKPVTIVDISEGKFADLTGYAYKLGNLVYFNVVAHLNSNITSANQLIRFANTPAVNSPSPVMLFSGISYVGARINAASGHSVLYANASVTASTDPQHLTTISMSGTFITNY